MMKINKLLSKTGFYYYNLLAFITNGNKRFVDKKLIFGALLIGFSGQYGCKTKNEEAKSDLNSFKNTENKKDTTLKDKITKLYFNNDSTLKRDINGIEINYTPTCYLISKKSEPKQPAQIEIVNKDIEIDDSLSDITCYIVIETQPEFPGGEEKLFKFLKDNITYPIKARENNVQGTVYVSFVIEKTGKINDVRVARGISIECDEEAVRIIKLMPDWKVAYQKGKPVRTLFNIPIKFTLDTVK